MASIEEHESSMTIFYYKRDGEIHSYCTGISGMERFGEHEQDYSLIIECNVFPKDETVIRYLNLFYIELETKQIKLKDESYDFSKYL